MNKSELIEKLAQRCGISIIQAEEVVTLIYRKMRDTLVSGGSIARQLRALARASVRIIYVQFS